VLSPTSGDTWFRLRRRGGAGRGAATGLPCGMSAKMCLGRRGAEI
jgi:hypothetical protein